MRIVSEVMSKCMLVMLFRLRIIYPTMVLMLLLNDLHIVRVEIMEELALQNVETRPKGSILTTRISTPEDGLWGEAHQVEGCSLCCHNHLMYL